MEPKVRVGPEDDQEMEPKDGAGLENGLEEDQMGGDQMISRSSSRVAGPL